MIPPNPLQELAEKAGDHFSHFVNKKAMVDFLLPLLTASVGTLLQAERAATIKECIETAGVYQRSASSIVCGLAPNSRVPEKVAEIVATEIINAMDNIPADSSALSAVVQRETAKLRELLREAAQHRHDLTQKWEGKYGPKGSRTACDSDGFDTCPTELCVKVRAALQ